jgi:hypothetical protein
MMRLVIPGVAFVANTINDQVIVFCYEPLRHFWPLKLTGMQAI